MGIGGNMKVGDLVRTKDTFAEWQKDNPWMKDKQLTGVVVETKTPPNGKITGQLMVRVHWFTDGVKWWCGAHKLEMVNESR